MYKLLTMMVLATVVVAQKSRTGQANNNPVLTDEAGVIYQNSEEYDKEPKVKLYSHKTSDNQNDYSLEEEDDYYSTIEEGKTTIRDHQSRHNYGRELSHNKGQSNDSNNHSVIDDQLINFDPATLDFKTTVSEIDNQTDFPKAGYGNQNGFIPDGSTGAEYEFKNSNTIMRSNNGTSKNIYPNSGFRRSETVGTDGNKPQSTDNENNYKYQWNSSPIDTKPNKPRGSYKPSTSTWPNIDVNNQDSSRRDGNDRGTVAFATFPKPETRKFEVGDNGDDTDKQDSYDAEYSSDSNRNDDSDYEHNRDSRRGQGNRGHDDNYGTGQDHDRNNEYDSNRDSKRPGRPGGNGHKPGRKDKHHKRQHRRTMKKTRVYMPSGLTAYITRPDTSNWECGKDKTKLITLNPHGLLGREEYDLVAHQMRSTIQYAFGCSIRQTCLSFNIIKIQKIVNGCVWKRYRDMQKELYARDGVVLERMLFNDAKNARSVIHNGYYMAHSSMDGDYGNGIYFSPHSSKTNEYVTENISSCGRNKKICHKQMFLARVSLGRKLESNERQDMPPRGYASVEAKEGIITKTKINIIFSGDQAYPEYLITYTDNQ